MTFAGRISSAGVVSGSPGYQAQPRKPAGLRLHEAHATADGGDVDRAAEQLPLAGPDGQAAGLLPATRQRRAGAVPAVESRGDCRRHCWVRIATVPSPRRPHQPAAFGRARDLVGDAIGGAIAELELGAWRCSACTSAAAAPLASPRRNRAAARPSQASRTSSVCETRANSAAARADRGGEAGRRQGQRQAAVGGASRQARSSQRVAVSESPAARAACPRCQGVAREQRVTGLPLPLRKGVGGRGRSGFAGELMRGPSPASPLPQGEGEPVLLFPRLGTVSARRRVIRRRLAARAVRPGRRARPAGPEQPRVPARIEPARSRVRPPSRAPGNGPSIICA